MQFPHSGGDYSPPLWALFPTAVGIFPHPYKKSGENNQTNNSPYSANKLGSYYYQPVGGINLVHN